MPPIIGPEVILRNAIRDQLQVEIQRQYYRVQRQLVAGVVSASNNGTRGATNRVRAFAVGIQKNFASEDDLLQAHKRVADSMRDGVIRSAGQSIKSGAGSYRIAGGGKRTKGGFLSRYSGGSLKKALKHPSLAVGTAVGINFVDEGRMTKEAAHWARLNFGARGTGVSGRNKRTFPFEFDGRKVANFGFNVGSRPAFFVPPGRWMSGGTRVGADPSRRGQDQFFPASKLSTKVESFRVAKSGRFKGQLVSSTRRKKTTRDRKLSRGIEPMEFMDAGLKRLSRDLPAEYDRLLDKWYNDAIKSEQLPQQVRVIPRPFGSR